MDNFEQCTYLWESDSARCVRLHLCKKHDKTLQFQTKEYSYKSQEGIVRKKAHKIVPGKTTRHGIFGQKLYQ